jgi:hypothetical protein
VHVATGSATALGATVMATTPTVATATKSREVRGRMTCYVASSEW